MMQKKITTRDLELLSSYLDGELTRRESGALEIRLKSEIILQVELNKLAETRKVLRAFPRMKAPRHFTLTPEMVSRKGVARSPWAVPMQFTSAFSAMLLVIVAAANLLINNTSLMNTSSQRDAAMQPLAVYSETVDESTFTLSEAALETQDVLQGFSEKAEEVPLPETDWAGQMDAEELATADEAVMPAAADAETEDMVITALDEPSDGESMMDEAAVEEEILVPEWSPENMDGGAGGMGGGMEDDEPAMDSPDGMLGEGIGGSEGAALPTEDRTGEVTVSDQEKSMEDTAAATEGATINSNSSEIGEVSPKTADDMIDEGLMDQGGTAEDGLAPAPLEPAKSPRDLLRDPVTMIEITLFLVALITGLIGWRMRKPAL